MRTGRMPFERVLTASVLASALLVSREASAQSAAASAPFIAALPSPTPARSVQEGNAQRARELFERGVTLADQLRWAEAAEAFERSYAALARPTTLRNLALAHRALGRYRRAISEIEQFMQSGTGDQATRDEMARFADEMRGQLATVTIQPTVGTAQVTLDDERVPAGEPIQADPGTHVVVATAPGYSRSAQTITLGRSERRTIDLRLDRAGGGVLSQWWFWTGVGVLLAGGVVTAVVLGSREADPDCGSLRLCVTPR